jgi:hypothetical protein
MKPMQRVGCFVRLEGFSVLVEALSSNALRQINSVPVHSHMLAAVLTLLQCGVYFLLKILYPRKRESAQVCLHRISVEFSAFHQMHTGCGDD